MFKFELKGDHDLNVGSITHLERTFNADKREVFTQLGGNLVLVPNPELKGLKKLFKAKDNTLSLDLMYLHDVVVTKVLEDGVEVEFIPNLLTDGFIFKVPSMATFYPHMSTINGEELEDLIRYSGDWEQLAVFEKLTSFDGSQLYHFSFAVTGINYQGKPIGSKYVQDNYSFSGIFHDIEYTIALNLPVFIPQKESLMANFLEYTKLSETYGKENLVSVFPSDYHINVNLTTPRMLHKGMVIKAVLRETIGHPEVQAFDVFSKTLGNLNRFFTTFFPDGVTRVFDGDEMVVVSNEMPCLTNDTGTAFLAVKKQVKEAK